MKRPDFKKLSAERLDLIIIGGGITGAAMAHEAALQGLKVALFEKNDFGSATSAATSKLIHGGMRYLKNFEFGLVRESLTERRILGDITPNLVEPLRFIIPAYKNKKLTNLMLRAGMYLYDGLSYDKGKVQEKKNALTSHASLSAEETLERAPMINEKGLSHSNSYFDYANINPDRMTLAFLKTAFDNGASIANYATVKGFLKKDQVIEGVEVLDQISGKSYQVKARFTINCSGSWVDEVLGLLNPGQQPTLIRSEGVHVITGKIRFKDAVAITTREGGHLMFLPWRGLTIVGPTDKIYEGSTDAYKPTKASVDEIVERINTYIPAEKMGGPFTYDDIVFHYGGLRPLIGVDSPDDTYKASRKYEIVDHLKSDGLEGLITVEGGKYTTSRGLAEHTLEAIAPRAGWNVNLVDSANYPLHPCNMENYAVFLADMKAKFGHLYPEATIEYYVRNFGLETIVVLESGLKSADGKMTLTHDGEILAEVDFVLENEMVYTLDDLLIRRTGIGLVGKPSKEIMDLISRRMAAHLHWDEAERLANIETFYQAYYTLP